MQRSRVAVAEPAFGLKETESIDPDLMWQVHGFGIVPTIPLARTFM